MGSQKESVDLGSQYLCATVRLRNNIHSGALRSLREVSQTMLFAGNSVTAQREGYTNAFHSRICAVTNQNHVVMKVGLGGTGSMGLASYWNTLINSQTPSLCFIETSTADVGGATPVSDIEPALIHMVTEAHGRGSEACFVHLPREDNQTVHRQPIIGLYEEVACRLGVSTIELGLTTNSRLAPEILVDGVHTTPLGASLIGDALADAILDVSSNIVSEPLRCSAPAGYTPLHVREWRNLRFENPPIVSKFKFLAEFAELGVGNCAIWIARSPSESLKGLQIVLGPRTAIVECQDDRQSVTIQTWEPTCDRHARLSYLPIPSTMRTSQKIEIRALSENSADCDITGQPSRYDHQGDSLRIVGVVSQSHDELS